jgi:hypothetical protein
MSFKDNFKKGQIGESLIARWLKRHHYHVLPVYEVEMDTGKGPRLFSPQQQLIAPDMLAFTDKKTIWIEAKHKTAFSLYRKTGQWTTGIDLRHYRDYCEVDDTTPFDVWLLFLQQGGHAKDSPETSPSGLYGNKLEYLREHEDHRSDKWGASGMVYWSIHALKKLDSLERVYGNIAPTQLSLSVEKHGRSGHSTNLIEKTLKTA